MLCSSPPLSCSRGPCRARRIFTAAQSMRHLLLNVWVILAFAALTHGLLGVGLLVRRRSLRAGRSSLRRTLQIEVLPLLLFTC